MKSLLLLSLASLVYSSPPSNSTPSNGNEKSYKCRQFKLALAKPEGKEAQFNVSTRTIMKKFALSKKSVVIKEKDLPLEQSPTQDDTKTDMQLAPSDVVVIDKPVSKPLWQRTLRWFYGDKILVFGIHVDGEVSDENQHGNVNLSGALCSPYTPELEQEAEELVQAAAEVANQIADDWESTEDEVAPQTAAAVDTNKPSNTDVVDQSISSEDANAIASVDASQVNELPADQQVPTISLQRATQTGLISAVTQPITSLGDNYFPPRIPFDDDSNVMIPKEIRGIRDY
jgi:hypothetical protein